MQAIYHIRTVHIYAYNRDIRIAILLFLYWYIFYLSVYIWQSKKYKIYVRKRSSSNIVPTNLIDGPSRQIYKKISSVKKLRICGSTAVFIISKKNRNIGLMCVIAEQCVRSVCLYLLCSLPENTYIRAEIGGNT